MVRLTRIYTRTGDRGETGLVDGSRLSKSAPRMAAIGDVDELNSAIGVALTHALPDDARAQLGRIQNELFDLGADFATPGPDFAPSEMRLRIVAAQVERLEAEIDAMNAELEPLRSFVLPGGDPGAAAVHLARAICRRAERAAVAADADVGLNPVGLAYVNRLSDHLFVLARRLNRAGAGDPLWKPGATR
ncbi:MULTISPECIES: cob(I)yrinic acid a,c-diamide adenosyltransferase [unclassified Sphingomonas]|uniref:cob(I)yrinic acid a,c-diamide adenosyltransferase n=1 Tax=unclassified Sphingomonas TaxID=196159 RepID=UPI0006F725DA|nr:MULTISPECIES: cob(I)yrinic acid a,c-diamide adenosyltransferase [unclassified Sphingomonas]KQX21601.1 cob(I)yrinic acid a c-diamide adenosyltransferase [Sphingomonas sp. Root1294]KQY72918.1 cob(I)yrinic acid a c-diamide adenosyltransferase [Sphingomonas sp. Root50]KRB88289.1 cob(I)yrinic acid a c-diamide adenosyltransferase [Sphingomonas sp. Root720]